MKILINAVQVKKMQNTDDITADILSNKKLQPMVLVLVIRRTKTKIFLAFTSQKKSMTYFIMTISKKINLFATSHQSDVDLTKYYKKCNGKPYSY